MIFEMVNHLTKVVREAFEIDRARHWGPPEVIVRLLVVAHLHPQVRSCLRHHALNKVSIVSTEDLVLEKAATLCLW